MEPTKQAITPAQADHLAQFRRITYIGSVKYPDHGTGHISSECGIPACPVCEYEARAAISAGLY